MVVWAGYLDGVASNRQFEVFGRRLSFVPPAVQAATRSDGATITPLNNGDPTNASVRELPLDLRRTVTQRCRCRQLSSR